MIGDEKYAIKLPNHIHWREEKKPKETQEKRKEKKNPPLNFGKSNASKNSWQT